MLSKNPKTRKKQKEEKELDQIWTKNVKARDNNMCQVCMKKVEGHNCQAHHILPKRIKGMRWDVNNGITLCYNHHKVGNFSAHMNAIWFTFWFKTNHNKQFRYIIDKLTRIQSK